MGRDDRPTVMVLDGDNENAIQVATELDRDLDVRVVGVGTSSWSRLLRSRHCHVGLTTVHPSDPSYAAELLAVVERIEPDLLVPVGHHSVVAADALRDRLPASVACWLPPSDSLAVALDKTATASFAADLDVATPRDVTDAVRDLDARGRPGAVADLPFPLFVKARYECGGNVGATAQSPASFWPTYDDVVDEADEDVVVQEYVPGERTYGCAILFDDGSPHVLFAHEEVRSVPRHGGSGTRVRVFRDPRAETAALRLLDELDWHGPALVEFKRRPDGTYVLMEINAKFWASYALASQSGYRFASTLAARALGVSNRLPDDDPARNGEKVFPLRELYYAATTEGESVLRAAAAMCWPPAGVDANLDDLRAWATPPASLVRRLDGGRPIPRIHGTRRDPSEAESVEPPHTGR